MSEAPKQLPTRVHPEDRARIAASNNVTTAYFGAPQNAAAISYYSPILIQCTLPHSDPKTRDWKKESGPYTLIVSSGVDRNLDPYGIPYGSFPRLVLAYIITQVKQTGECRIELSSRFTAFMQEIGYTGNYKGKGGKGQQIRQQLLKLLRASITWDDSGQGHESATDVKIAPRFELWFDESRPDEASLFESYIMVSQEFRDAILRAPVPLRTDVLRALRKSPLALDVYMWVSYRLFVMQAAGQEELSLSYGMLQQQFGTGISEADYRTFRKRLKATFDHVAQYWQTPDSNGTEQQLHYKLDRTRFVLYRSPLLIETKRSPAEDAARQIMERRSFDDVTRKKARQIAGNWDLNFLTGQYFAWITEENITPKDPRSHFLAFIKSHKQRNGNG